VQSTVLKLREYLGAAVDGGLPFRIQRSLPCKRALAMNRPSNSSVLFPPEMQRRTEELKKISEEVEDG